MEHMVSVNNLKKQFGEFTAVNNITFNVKKGEIFGFLGPNGAGKSTTIKMLCGILMPTDGEGKVSGFDINDEQEKIKRIIGYMSQRFSLYDDLTVIENLEFFGSIYGLTQGKLKESINEVISMAGLRKRKKELVKNLPGGHKQRLALGCSIIHDPPILFLDEPTSGVDPIMRRNFWDIIYQFAESGKTIFVTTHYMDETEHCDRIAFIIQGSIIALDSPGKLKESLPYDVYSLEVNNFIKVFDMIQNIEGVHEAAIFGSEIHLLCESETKGAQKIRSQLKKLEIGKFKLQKVSPSLEDVFVTSAQKYK